MEQEIISLRDFLDRKLDGAVAAESTQSGAKKLKDLIESSIEVIQKDFNFTEADYCAQALARYQK